MTKQEGRGGKKQFETIWFAKGMCGRYVSACMGVHNTCLLFGPVGAFIHATSEHAFGKERVGNKRALGEVRILMSGNEGKGFT